MEILGCKSMTSIKNSYQNKENRKEKALTTDRVQSVDRFFAPDDQTAKEAATAIDEKLRDMANRIFGKPFAKSRYWKIDGNDGSVIDTSLSTPIINRDYKESYYQNNTVNDIERALRVFLKWEMIPGDLSLKDKVAFRRLIDSTLGEDRLDHSVKTGLKEIVKQCQSSPFSRESFWFIEGKDLGLNTNLLALYPIGDQYIIYGPKRGIDQMEKSIKEIMRFGGFKFETPDWEELVFSFVNYGYIPYASSYILSIENSLGNEIGVFHCRKGNVAESHLNKDILLHVSPKLFRKLTSAGLPNFALIPICRLVKRNKRNELVHSLEKALLLCMEHGLVPEAMPDPVKQEFRDLIRRYEETKKKKPESLKAKAPGKRLLSEKEIKQSEVSEGIQSEAAVKRTKKGSDRKTVKNAAEKVDRSDVAQNGAKEGPIIEHTGKSSISLKMKKPKKKMEEQKETGVKMQDESLEMKKERQYVEFWKKALDQLKKLTDEAHLDGYYDPIFKQLANRLTDNEFRLAVVGQFSSGKSTFINAIIGKDILSHALDETTAAITRIINVKADDPRANTGIIRFQNGTEKKLDDFSQLKTYTTKSSTTYEVAKEIRLVELYVPFIPDGTPLILVDTPGLNGTSGLETITNDLVREANACIYLFQARGLSEKDLDYLKFIRDYQHSFIFVQGFMDDIHSSEGETPESKLKKLKESLQQNVFGEKNTNYWKVCGVSALQELAGKDAGITRLYQNADHDLTTEERLQLRKSSGFSSFRDILSKDFSGDKLIQIKYRDTAEAVCSLAREIRDLVHGKLEKKEKAWEMSQEAQNLKNLTERKNGLEKAKKEQEEALSGCVENVCDKILEVCNDQMAKWAEQCVNKQKERIDQLSTLDSVKAYQKEVPIILKREIDGWSLTIDRYVGQSFQELHSLILNRIERYTSQNLEALQSNMPIRTARITLPEQAFSMDWSGMKWIQDQIDAKQREIDRAESAWESSQGKVWSYESNQRSIKSQLDDIGAIERARLARLGGRPDPKEVWHDSHKKWYQFWKSSGYWSTDDSNVKEWENERTRIHNERVQEETRLKNQLREVNRELGNARYSVRENKDRKEQLEEERTRLYRQLNSKKALYEKEERVAKKNYLNNCRNTIRESIAAYFNDESSGQIRKMMDYLKGEIKEEEKAQTEEALKLYRKVLDDEIRDIGTSADNLKKQVNAIKAQKESITALVKEMEAGLA
ncbi:dynamin family protein [Dialister sp.]|uniref:dynamin family protein n=1 Tax=Dialister sp. TaxID=1955814 RepID=UPI002E7FF9E0|nr:dynamin family protein [Dialister sp.]MEE3453147.1 dynamin family protein [Dialister sp.]